MGPNLQARQGPFVARPYREMTNGTTLAVTVLGARKAPGDWARPWNVRCCRAMAGTAHANRSFGGRGIDQK